LREKVPTWNSSVSRAANDIRPACPYLHHCRAGEQREEVWRSRDESGKVVVEQGIGRKVAAGSSSRRKRQRRQRMPPGSIVQPLAYEAGVAAEC